MQYDTTAKGDFEMREKRKILLDENGQPVQPTAKNREQERRAKLQPDGTPHTGQIGMCFTANTPYWSGYKAIEALASKGFYSSRGSIARELLQQRMILFDAGWGINDEEMGTRLEAIVRLNDGPREEIDRMLREWATRKTPLKASRKRAASGE